MEYAWRAGKRTEGEIIKKEVEKCLQEKLCTFVATKEVPTEQVQRWCESHVKRVQEWFHCETCGLERGDGCCQTCAKYCHRDHRGLKKAGSSFDVTDLSIYKGFSRKICDCGAGLNEQNTPWTPSRKVQCQVQKEWGRFFKFGLCGQLLSIASGNNLPSAHRDTVLGWYGIR